MRLMLTLAALAFATVTPALKADAIPYPNIGHIAPQVTTYAAGSGAGFTDYIRVFDVATGYNSGDILNNQTTALGTEITVGSGGFINAGDQLIFYIDSPEGLFASIAADSDDGVNHGYITTYSGGTLGSTSVGPGLYVGLEDEASADSDFNYYDDTFVFTGVRAPSISGTPEPGSLILFGTGLLSAAGVARRRFSR